MKITPYFKNLLHIGLFGLVGMALAVLPGVDNAMADNAQPLAKAQVQEAYGKLPLSFEANRGQTDSQVKFLNRGRGYTLFLTRTEAVLALRHPTKSQENALRIRLMGVNSASSLVGAEELPGKVNYFIGNDPKKWRTNIPTYAEVKHKDVYSGVDLVYYGNQRQLEFDFMVAPGADPTVIRLAVEGADRLAVDAQGDLVLYVGDGELRLQKPVVYQAVKGIRQEVSGSYVLTDRHQVGFQVGAYDASRPLIIDPVLFYSTYLGGSGGDSGGAIAVDASGNAYVSGTTTSTNFPTTLGAFQTAFSGVPFDAFVTKLNPTGSGLIYSTYLGGSGDDFGRGIAVDALPSPNAYVTGFTSSTNFPTTPGAFQATFAGGPEDAFVAKVTEAMIPPGQAMQRVTGGGTINVVGGIGTFSFIVQRQATTGQLSGHLQYINHASGAQVRSDTITSLTIIGNTATFDGPCTVNGAPCTFTVNVTDNGEPGTTDTFTISVSGGPTEGGTLRSGNILIR